MYFDVKNLVGSSDVPIAYLSPTPVRSQDVILGYDVSASIPGNPSPAIGSILSRTRRFEAVSELEIKSPFAQVEVTDIYFYDVELKINKPLWYQHVLRAKVFNKTAQSGQFSLSGVTGQTVLQPLTTKEKTIIAGSELIFRTSVGGQQIAIGDYFINYADKSLTVNLGSVTNVSVGFTTVLNNVEVSQSDRSRYLVQYQKAAEDEYVVVVYTESKQPIVATYSTRLADGTTKRIKEKTNPVPIYHEIDGSFIGDIENTAKKVFSVVPFNDNNFRVLISQNPFNENAFKTFAFRQKENVYTKFYLLKPLNANVAVPWRTMLVGSGFIYRDKANDLTYTFSLREKRRHRVIEKITEAAEYVDKNTLRVRKTPLWEIDGQSNIVGIDAVEETSGAVLEIVGIETGNRIIKITQDIGKLSRINISYRTVDDVAYIDNNLNPVIDPSAYNYYHLYYIVPDESLSPDAIASVYVHRLPRFTNGQQLIWNSRDFLQYFDLNKAFILEEIEQNLSVTAKTAAAFLVDIFYIDTPVDADFIAVYDSRVRGGGFIKEYEYTGDWTYWNGEALDISGRLLVRIKQSVWDSLKQRYLAYDEDVNRSANPDALATSKTNDHITASINKHTRQGFYAEFVLEADP